MTWPHTGKMDAFVMRCLGSGRYVAQADGHIVNTNYRNSGKPRLVAEVTGSHGYLQCHLSDGEYRTSVSVHRVICLALLGSPPPGSIHEVNHINGVKSDNRISNLEWLTVSDNCKHALSTGLRDIAPHIRMGGAESAASRLTDADVFEIFRLASEGMSSSKIAVFFGVSRSNISMILRGDTWRDHPCNSAKKGPPRSD